VEASYDDKMQLRRVRGDQSTEHDELQQAGVGKGIIILAICNSEARMILGKEIVRSRKYDATCACDLKYPSLLDAWNCWRPMLFVVCVYGRLVTKIRATCPDPSLHRHDTTFLHDPPRPLFCTQHPSPDPATPIALSSGLEQAVETATAC
jgi:hypothetical protein